VAGVGEILRRFRFHGVPGAPATAAVPVDRGAELEAELAPVFSALEGAEARAAEIVAVATDEADRERTAAARQGQQVLVGARGRAGVVRAAAAASRLAQAETERARILQAAADEARRVEQLARERTPSLAEEVARRAMSEDPGR
jgi:hypothetical protein